MKTFGELKKDDFIFIMKDGDKIEAKKVLKITARKEYVHINYPYKYLICFINLPKKENTFVDNMFSFVYFSCKNAVEEYLLQLERDERDRHWNEKKRYDDCEFSCQDYKDRTELYNAWNNGFDRAISLIQNLKNGTQI